MLGLALGDDDGSGVGLGDGLSVGVDVGCGVGRDVGMSQQLDQKPVAALGQQLASPGSRRIAAHRGFMGLAQSDIIAGEVQSKHVSCPAGVPHPDGQASQAAWPAASANQDDGHCSQATGPVCPVTSWKEPGRQNATHAVAPVALWYCPPMQLTHGANCVAPTSAWYCPGWHVKHLSWPVSPWNQVAGQPGHAVSMRDVRPVSV